MLGIVLLWLLLIFLLATGACACGLAKTDQPDWRSIKSIDSEFREYYTDFFEISGRDPFNVSAGFVVGLSDNKIGMCRVRGRYAQIEIVYDYWHTQLKDNFASRQELIFHELGHCVLRRFTHVEGFLDGGCPKSIMNPYNFGDPCYTDNYSHYVDELLSQSGRMMQTLDIGSVSCGKSQHLEEEDES